MWPTWPRWKKPFKGQDAVLSALGSSSLKRNPALVKGVENIVQAMQQHNVRRLIYQSSLGVGDSRERVGFLIRYIIIPLVLRNAIADHEAKERIIKQSNLDWVIVRPAGLRNEPRTGEYRTGGRHRVWLYHFPRRRSRLHAEAGY